MPHCVNCGVELKSKDRFCHKCGQRVVKSKTSAVEKKEADSVLRESTTNKKEQHGLSGELIKNLKDKACALGPEVLNTLIRSLRSVPTINLQRRAAEVLGEIGSKKAVKALREALKDKNRWVRESAAEALGKIGDLRAVEALEKALKDSWPHTRVNAAEALNKLAS